MGYEEVLQRDGGGIESGVGDGRSWVGSVGKPANTNVPQRLTSSSFY